MVYRWWGHQNNNKSNYYYYYYSNIITVIIDLENPKSGKKIIMDINNRGVAVVISDVKTRT